MRGRHFLHRIWEILLAEPDVVVLPPFEVCPFYTCGRCDPVYCHQRLDGHAFTCAHEDRGGHRSCTESGPPPGEPPCP